MALRIVKVQFHTAGKLYDFNAANLDLKPGDRVLALDTLYVDALLMILRILVRAPLLLVGSLIMAIVTCPQLAFLPLVLMPIELAAVVWVAFIASSALLTGSTSALPFGKTNPN